MINIDAKGGIITERIRIALHVRNGIVGEIAIPMNNSGLYVHIHGIVISGNRVYLQWAPEMIEIPTPQEDSIQVGVANLTADIIPGEIDGIDALELTCSYVIPDSIKKEFGF